MSASSSQYPLWIGVLAFGAFGWLFVWSAQAPNTVDAPVIDAGQPPPKAPMARLLWQVSGRELPTVAALTTCLEAHGYAATVLASRDGLTVNVPNLPLAQGVVPDGARLSVRTPVAGQPRRAARLHVATASCLKAPGATLFDPLLSRRYTLDEWPTLLPSGGVPVGAIVEVVEGQGTLKSRGLVRLGLPELGLRLGGGDVAAQAHGLRQAVAGLVAHDGEIPSTLRVGAETVTLVGYDEAVRAGWWPAGARVEKALGYEEGPWRVKAAASGTQRPGAQRPGPRASAVREIPTLRTTPAARRRAKSKPIPRPPARSKPKPRFMPDYR